MLVSIQTVRYSTVVLFRGDDNMLGIFEICNSVCCRQVSAHSTKNHMSKSLLEIGGPYTYSWSPELVPTKQQLWTNCARPISPGLSQFTLRRHIYYVGGSQYVHLQSKGFTVLKSGRLASGLPAAYLRSKISRPIGKWWGVRAISESAISESIISAIIIMAGLGLRVTCFGTVAGRRAREDSPISRGESVLLSRAQCSRAGFRLSALQRCGGRGDGRLSSYCSVRAVTTYSPGSENDDYNSRMKREMMNPYEYHHELGKRGVLLPFQAQALSFAQ